MSCEKCKGTGIQSRPNFISGSLETIYCDCLVYCGIRQCNGWNNGLCEKQQATVCLRKNNKVL